jgi:flagellar hook-basal body complex protein FliE
MEEFSRIADTYWTGALPAAAPPQAPAAGPDFGALLRASLDEVGRLQAAADRAVVAVSQGRGADLHATMIAVEKAGIALELAMQVRNKLLTAYETIMRTQV